MATSSEEENSNSLMDESMKVMNIVTKESFCASPSTSTLENTTKINFNAAAMRFTRASNIFFCNTGVIELLREEFSEESSRESIRRNNSTEQLKKITKVLTKLTREMNKFSNSRI